MMRSSVSNADAAPGAGELSEPAGVPLGGLGAGCIEMGRDGRFRNITINNNRTAQTRISVSPCGFLAVRAAKRGRVFARLLQAESEAPFSRVGIVPNYTPPEQLSWRGLYPASSYELNDPEFPVRVRWTALSPIIPYDLEASTLPVVIVSFELANFNDVSIEASVLFNWENLCGCVRGHFPTPRGPIRISVAETDEEEDEGEGEERPPVPIGLEFGFRGPCRTNAEGNYCLLAHQQANVRISVMGWNEQDTSELQVFWEQFYNEGELRNQISRNPRSHSGAVCCSCAVAPQTRRSLAFALAWFCPRFVVDGVDQGNGYANVFADARAVAERALKHRKYYFASVENWHKRFLSSSLPRWLSRMLINNSSVFSTNTLLTKDGKFAMMETPGDPVTGAIDRRFYSSLGTLLFFPELETRELAQFTKQEDTETPAPMYRRLGAECVHRPHHGETHEELLDIPLKFVLMAYRNYHMTGMRPILDHLYPKVKQCIEYVLSKDEDGDGLPEQYGCTTTFDTWAFYGANSYTSSLWIAALRAYVKLTRRLGLAHEAKQHDALSAKAIAAFEKRLWNEKAGFYRLYHDPRAEGTDHPEYADGCHSGQLAGQWFADFLCLGRFLPEEHVVRALEAMYYCTEKPFGVALGCTPDGLPCTNPPSVPQRAAAGTGWVPCFTTEYACLQMAYGRVDRGLRAVEKVYVNAHVKRGRVFNQPLAWDLTNNKACGWGNDRHMGSLAIWHVLYALEGFFLNVPDKALWIRPNLPLNVHQLSAPLFTPLCLGWMTYREMDEETYRQEVRVAFDSPVPIQTIVLRVPREVEEVHVRCVSEEGPEQTEHIFGYDGDMRLVEILPKRPVVVQTGLTVGLRQTHGPRVQFKRYKR